MRRSEQIASRLLTRRRIGRRWLNDSEGAFTVEASLTFPLVLLCTFAVVFACLFMYQQAAIHFTASVTSERTAYVWDGAGSKQFDTGEHIAGGKQDGLYWRTFQDRAADLVPFLAGLFGSERTQVTLPSGASVDVSGPEGKLQGAASHLPSGIGGALTYRNGWFQRKVEAELSRPAHKPPFVQRLLSGSRVGGSGASYIVEPVEFIRNVDLARTFIQEIAGRLKPSQVVDLLQEPATELDQTAPIGSHNEAAAYLRKLVNGKETWIEVKQGQRRLIDALDAGGIAHQALYTFSESQLRSEQLPKDAALLSQGTAVKGVVWHFFKQSKKDKVVLSASLLAELRRNNIVVVIHE